MFVNYLTKWLEVFVTPNQSAPTIAQLLVEHIVCGHCVPAKLPSDRGASFLFCLVSEMCEVPLPSCGSATPQTETEKSLGKQGCWESHLHR